MNRPPALDFVVVGGGIVGLATAHELLQQVPGASVALVEKEDRLAAHQSGHNSGVIHAGVYYEPGSLKARLSHAGLQQTLDFCQKNAVIHQQCGKLILAVTPAEVAPLEALHARALANGAAVRWLVGPEIQALEPNVVGVAGLLVAATGIVDYVGMCQALARQIALAGGEIKLNTPVQALREGPAHVALDTPQGTLYARQVIVCGGLQADRLLRASGITPDFAIVPFRGDYFRLPATHNQIVKHLIYPVPDPRLPFLGIHLTRLFDGGVSVGPSAMLALSREDYRRHAFDWRDAWAAARYAGTWRLLARYPGAGLRELGCALSQRRYLRAVQRYCPSLTQADLLPCAPGIRAQAVSPSGHLIHDFLLKQTTRMLHVCNAPSPAATAALPIAAEIVTRLLGAQHPPSARAASPLNSSK